MGVAGYIWEYFGLWDSPRMGPDLLSRSMGPVLQVVRTARVSYCVCKGSNYGPTAGDP